METYIDDLSLVDDECVITNSIVINSVLRGVSLRNSLIVNSQMVNTNIHDSSFIDSTVEDSYIIEKTYCVYGDIKESLDIVRCHINGEKDNRVVINGGGRPVVLTRCWFTKNAKVAGGDAWNSYFGENSIIDDCDIIDSEFENITVSRRIIENNVVGDYELPISKDLVVIEIDDEETK